MTDTTAVSAHRAELDETMAHIIGACRCENRGCRVYLTETAVKLVTHLGQGPQAVPTAFPVVTICGSMRFYPRMLKIAANLTAAGSIVLMPHDASLTGIENKTAIDHGRMLDEMHRAKIRLAQSVYIVNTGGYIGESTRGEIEYAEKLGLPVQYDEEN